MMQKGQWRVRLRLGREDNWVISDGEGGTAPNFWDPNHGIVESPFSESYTIYDETEANNLLAVLKITGKLP